MEDYKSLIAEYQRLPSPPRILIGIPPSQYAQAEPARRAPKRRINPCLICLHLISLVAQLKRWISLSCLLRRHLISLVAQVRKAEPARRAPRALDRRGRPGSLRDAGRRGGCGDEARVPAERVHLLGGYCGRHGCGRHGVRGHVGVYRQLPVATDDSAGDWQRRNVITDAGRR